MENAALPEWVIYVASVVGTVIAAAVARLGWKKEGESGTVSGGGDIKAEISALDSSSAIMLSASITAATQAFQESARQTREERRTYADALAGLTAAVVQLTEVVVQSEERQQRENEEREERERRTIERENDRLQREIDRLRQEQRGS